MYWPVASPDRVMMVGTAYQSIGLGFPSVAGAIAARPDATVVLTTGDGGGLMAIADLESAVRTAGGHGIAVVWNDAAYGAEINLYGLKGLAREPMLIPRGRLRRRRPRLRRRGRGRARGRRPRGTGRMTRRDPAERPFLLLDLRISGTVIAPYQREIIKVNS